MSPTAIQFLRILHIVGGAWWLGAIVFSASIVIPAIRATGPAGGAVMQHMVEVRKLPLFMMFIPIITVLAGFALYWNDSSGTNGQWARSGPGMTFGFGAALAIALMVLGMAVNAPTAKRLSKLGAEIRQRGGPPSADEQAEMLRLQSRLAMAMQAAAVLIILAAIAMSVARYMPS